MKYPLRRFCVLLLLASPVTAQSTWFVDVTGTPPGTGTSTDPYVSLQFAIDQATTVDGDTLLVLPGTYNENVDLSGKELVVRSTGGAAVTTIDAGGVDNALIVANGEGPGTTVEGLTLTAGSSALAYFGGGGVRVFEANLTLRSCRIVGNFTPRFRSGSGMYMVTSTVVIEDSLIANNGSSPLPGGGAGIYSTNCTLTLRRTTLEQNFGSFGGGLSLGSGVTTIEDCVFRDCAADTDGFGEGGGIYAFTNAGVDGHLTIDRCVFEDNYAFDFGGAIQVDPTNGTNLHLTVRDCVFDRNEADLIGGAISAFSADGSVIVERCTFSENTLSPIFSFHTGAAVSSTASDVRYSDCVFFKNTGGNTISVNADALLERCTVTLNQTPSGNGPLPTILGGILRDSIVYFNEIDEVQPTSATYSDIQGGFSGTGNLDVNPLFMHRAVGDVRLRPLSPCIDVGDPLSPLDPDGTRADMGAFPNDQSITCPAPEIFCAPKLHSGGCFAEIGWSGTPSLSGQGDFHVTANQVLANKSGIAFVGPEPRNSPLFGGLRCSGGASRRIGPLFSGSSGGACSGTFDITLDQAFLAGYGPSGLLHVQFLFRDPGSPVPVSMTGGLRVYVCP